MVTTAFAPEAFYRNGKGKTVVVDPASFTRPGGAYEDGAFGPEQIICSESNLYQVLCGIGDPTTTRTAIIVAASCSPTGRRICPAWRFSRGGVRRADVIAISSPCASERWRTIARARVRQRAQDPHRGVSDHRRGERVRDADRRSVRLRTFGVSDVPGHRGFLRLAG